MLAQQRRHLIVSALNRSSFVALHDAVEFTGASEATIRRDFAVLSAQGRVRRCRGGVEIVMDSARDDEPTVGITQPETSPLVSLPLDSRLALREQAKQLIAAQASLLCRDGQTVFLDAGSTALYLARYLGGMSLRVITNSFAAARVIFDTGCAEIVLVGGQIDRSSEVVFSYVDSGTIENHPPDIAFLGAQGIDASGYYNSDERLIRLERHVARVATQTVLICDSSKFGLRGRIRVAALDELDTIVTDAGVSDEYEEMVSSAGVRLMKVR